jgi:hypothetical protein
MLAVAAIVAGGFAWTYWPHRPGTDAPPPTAIREQQASPDPSADAANGKVAQKPNDRPTLPSVTPVSSSAVGRMTKSWKDTHDEFQKLMEQVDAGNRQLEKENQGHAATAGKSTAP